MLIQFHADFHPFPQELKNYFQENRENDDSIKLDSFFDKNPSVRKAFVDWAAEHQSLVEYTPRLYLALQLATPNEKYEVVAKSINSFFLAVCGSDTAKKIQMLLTSVPKDEDKLPDNFLKESLELYKCGLLDKKQLLRLIDGLQKTYKGSKDINYNLKRLEKEIPDLWHINDLDILLKIFLLVDSIGHGPLHYPKIEKEFVPFLMELEPDIISRLILDYFYLHDESYKIAEMLFPILCKLDSTKLFSVLTSLGMSDMLDEMMKGDVWELFFRADVKHFFSRFNMEEKKWFFSSGREILNSPEYEKKLTEFLNSCSEKELLNFCSEIPFLTKFIDIS